MTDLTAPAAAAAASSSLEGRCTCGRVRYRLHDEPLIVHCCHCTDCQRESGSAFAVNALVFAEHVETLGDSPVVANIPSNSGMGQKIARCQECGVTLWSNYNGAGPLVRFIRVGTLDEPKRFKPDVHIYTRSKAPWMTLPQGVPAYEESYDVPKVWGKDVDERRYNAMLRIQAARATQADGTQ